VDERSERVERWLQRPMLIAAALTIPALLLELDRQSHTWREVGRGWAGLSGEAEALRRAIDGSDRLLIMLLRARCPAVYREDVRVEHAGKIEHGPAGLEALSDAELIERLGS